MILRASIRPESDDGRRQELRAEAADFTTARDQIDADTPDGWIRLHLIAGNPEPADS